jgi:hypothetical protein
LNEIAGGPVDFKRHHYQIIGTLDTINRTQAGNQPDVTTAHSRKEEEAMKPDTKEDMFRLSFSTPQKQQISKKEQQGRRELADA